MEVAGAAAAAADAAAAEPCVTVMQQVVLLAAPLAKWRPHCCPAVALPPSPAQTPVFFV